MADLSSIDVSMDVNNLYREEIVTDRQAGTLRMMVPITSLGTPDTARATLYVGEAQLMTLATARTGMAVAIDIGQANDIHPRDKMDVGQRLALAALHVAYGRQLVYSGPIYESASIAEGKVRVRFRHIGSGLTIAAAPSTQPGVAPAAPEVLRGIPEIAEFAPKIDDDDRLRAALAATVSEGVTIVAGDADPYCPGGAESVFAKPLGAEFVVVPGGGHLTIEDGFGPFPLVRDLVSR